MGRRPAAAFVVFRVIAAKVARNVDRVASAEGKVRRIADDDVEAALREDLGEFTRPAKRCRAFQAGGVDERMTGAEVMGETGQSTRLAFALIVEAREQKGKLGDIDGHRVDVDAENGVFEDGPSRRRVQAKFAVRAAND